MCVLCGESMGDLLAKIQRWIGVLYAMRCMSIDEHVYSTHGHTAVVLSTCMNIHEHA